MTLDKEDEPCTHPNGFGVYGCPCGMTRDQYEQEQEDRVSSVYMRTTTITRYEMVVPAKEPWGACWSDVQHAMAQIGRTWRGVNNVAPNPGIPDDAIRVHASDENDGQIVFSFTIEKDQ